MQAFEKFYFGEKGNSQSDLNVLNMTVHTFPKDFAEIFWKSALEWYQSIMAKFEKNCQTDGDYKTLHSILKQVLENEVHYENTEICG